MLNTNLLRHAGGRASVDEGLAAMRLNPARIRRGSSNNASIRRVTTSANPAATQYHISKRLIHIGVPVLIATLAILRVTDPTRAPQPARKSVEDVQLTCNRIHARDLDRYIKSNLDGISDEHTVAWNKMHNDFKEHRKNEGEPARLEKENARLLAQYARIEDNKSRSTKVEGIMATHGGNTNIGHRPETVGEAVEEKAQTIRQNIAARWKEARRRITKVIKGSALF